MLLPSGRCYTTYDIEVDVKPLVILMLMADVIAMYIVADVKTTEADVIAYCFIVLWLMFL